MDFYNQYWTLWVVLSQLGLLAFYMGAGYLLSNIQGPTLPAWAKRVENILVSEGLRPNGWKGVLARMSIMAGYTAYGFVLWKSMQGSSNPASLEALLVSNAIVTAACVPILYLYRSFKVELIGFTVMAVFVADGVLYLIYDIPKTNSLLHLAMPVHANLSPPALLNWADMIVGALVWQAAFRRGRESFFGKTEWGLAFGLSIPSVAAMVAVYFSSISGGYAELIIADKPAAYGEQHMLGHVLAYVVFWFLARPVQRSDKEGNILLKPFNDQTGKPGE